MADNNDKIISSPALDYIPNPGGLGCAFFEKMQENQDKLAQVNGLTGEEETYKTFLKRCIRTAITMRSKGVTQDDFITISSIASMDVCVPFVATLFLGAKPVTLDPNYSLENLIYMLNHIKPKMIFAGFEVVENMETAIKDIPGDIEIVVFGNTPNHTPFSNFLKAHSKEDDFKPLPAKSLTETALILFSSGTTGLPKGVCLNHYGFLVTCYHSGYFLRHSRVLTFASVYWVSTLDLLVTSVLYGDCRIVVPGFDPTKFWDILETCKVVDIETEELLGPNQRGELRVQSKIVMNGYCNRDSSDVWDSEGYLKTGDVGYYDEDRCFYIVGRVKEILKFRQSDVFPAVLETVILQHPTVEATIVIGIPHEEDGNHLIALVVLSKAAKETTQNEIQKFVEERVNDAQKLRAGVKFVDRIPMTATGKINRTDIRDKVLHNEI